MHYFAFSAIIAAVVIIGTFNSGIVDFLAVDINGPVFDLNGLPTHRDKTLDKIFGRINRINKNNDVPALRFSEVPAGVFLSMATKH